MINLFFYKLGAFLAHYLPTNISEFITRSLARVYFFTRIPLRRLVMDNIRIVTGEDPGRKILRDKSKKVIQNFARSIYLFLRIPYVDPDELRRSCDYDGFDDLTRKLSKKGGFIIVGPHLGPWEVGAACMGATGLKLNTVAHHHPSARVTEFFAERRRVGGMVSYPAEKSFSALQEALRRGECVVLLIDRAYGTTEKVFPWFGTETKLPVGHLALALRCDVPVVTTSCIFTPNGGLRFVHSGPYYPAKDKDDKQAMSELQRQCIEALETSIRIHHEQWFNFFPLRTS